MMMVMMVRITTMMMLIMIMMLTRMMMMMMMLMTMTGQPCCYRKSVKLFRRFFSINLALPTFFTWYWPYISFPDPLDIDIRKENFAE